MSKYFTPAETRCRCGCGLDVTPVFLSLLDAIREDVGQPLTLNCGARCALHNAAVGGAKNSAHILGLAADIACMDSHLRFLIYRAAIKLGVTRIERDLRTPTWVHIDIADDKLHPQEVVF